jgi:hypothetical protein
MEKSPNGSIIDMPGDNRHLAIEIFEKVKKFMEDQLPLCEIDRGVQWATLEAATVPVIEQSESEVDVVSHDVCLDYESVHQHFISTVVFRCIFLLADVWGFKLSTGITKCPNNYVIDQKEDWNAILERD